MNAEPLQPRDYDAAFASCDGNKVCVMVWHYHDDDVPGPDADIQLEVAGLPLAATGADLQEYRVDQEHGNAYTVWQRLGSPQQPTPEQYAQLEKAGQLAAFPAGRTVAIQKGRADWQFKLPRQAVSLFVLEWKSP